LAKWTRSVWMPARAVVETGNRALCLRAKLSAYVFAKVVEISVISG
jgi:hypothetical protein